MKMGKMKLRTVSAGEGEIDEVLMKVGDRLALPE
jgi:hypothetical protein